MEDIIPLHALVLLGAHHEPGLAAAFPAHEHLSVGGVQTDLLGQAVRIDLASIMLGEVRRRAALKLSLGERVVVRSAELHAEDRAWLLQIARRQGAGLYQSANEGLAEPDMAVIGPHWRPALPLPTEVAELRRLGRGMTVIPDVHGDLDALNRALQWARSRRHLAWVLGDVLDHGPEALACLTQVYHLVMRGEASFVIGNHERKIARYLAEQESDGPAVKLNEGNRVTVAALAALSAEARQRWVGQFRALLARSGLISQIGSVTFVHGAVHPHVWGSQRPDQRQIERYALFGEPDDSAEPPAFGLSYRWIDRVPAGQTVFVGHDTRSKQVPVMMTGAKGGRVVFLDTGCGKGGVLSTADLRFVASGHLRLESYNVHG